MDKKIIVISTIIIVFSFFAMSFAFLFTFLDRNQMKVQHQQEIDELRKEEFFLAADKMNCDSIDMKLFHRANSIAFEMGASMQRFVDFDVCDEHFYMIRDWDGQDKTKVD